MKKKIYMCLAHMSESGEEMKYINQAFDENWVVWNLYPLYFPTLP